MSSYLSVNIVSFLKSRLIFNIFYCLWMFVNKLRISQELKGVLMWILQHIFFIWRRRYWQILNSQILISVPLILFFSYFEHRCETYSQSSYCPSISLETWEESTWETDDYWRTTPFTFSRLGSYFTHCTNVEEKIIRFEKINFIRHISSPSILVRPFIKQFYIYILRLRKIKLKLACFYAITRLSTIL